ncbi:hypothetical protein JZO78_04465 [Enterococcus ureilyticus]|uniref:hypothetical protein n=1 Tax=Enterococcus ureilyticus TaxID=1131292 RepID=UPI001A930480|nr:hypothetical protein [Enterococcus ureilyticus]MBO0445589.1 hypothetical protein [Enterococcus ureilyticus]
MKGLKERRVPQRLVYIVDPEYLEVIQSELKSALQMLCIRHADISHDGEELTILFLATNDEAIATNCYINDTYDFIGD